MVESKSKTNARDIQERAFSFACRIVKLYKYMAQQKGVGQILGKQVLRAGTSIGANLEEASGGQSKADFISKCNIALKEARETHYWLRLLSKSEVVVEDKLSSLTSEAYELVAILTSIVKKARSCK